MTQWNDYIKRSLTVTPDCQRWQCKISEVIVFRRSKQYSASVRRLFYGRVGLVALIPGRSFANGSAYKARPTPAYYKGLSAVGSSHPSPSPLRLLSLVCSGCVFRIGFPTTNDGV